MRRQTGTCNSRVVEVERDCFLSSLYSWWRENRRDFPWRYSNDPYRVLLAELFLHRTAARQAASVFLKFTEKFPDMDALLRAEPESIMECMKPLGLRWRQELFLRMLDVIREVYGGTVPSEYEELRKLPGAGDYVARAFLVFYKGEPGILLDSGMVRFLGRFFCQKITDGSRRSKKFRILMQNLIDKKDPRSFYYALIDLSALVCTPRNPACPECPVNILCCYKRKLYGGEPWEN